MSAPAAPPVPPMPPEPPAAAPVLDPRVLPAGTALRFGLLLLSMVVAGHHMLTTMLDLVRTGRGAEYVCKLAAGFDPDADFLAQLDVAPWTDPALRACLAAVPGDPSWPVPVALALVLAAAAALYLLLPRWRRRSRRLVPVDEPLRAELRRLAERARLPVVPEFVVDPGRLDPGAVAFGHPRRRTVCLYGGLSVTWRTDPAGFRAVVLHEFAHIRNRDVDLGYAVTALWRVFALLVALPFVLLVGGTLVGAEFGLFVGADRVFWPAGRAPLVRQAATALGMALLVVLARADTLRHRELYADADAVALGADRRVWDVRDPVGPAARLGRLWRSHPTWAQRRRALDDPAALFTLAPLQTFLVGAAGVAVPLLLPPLAGGAVGVWLATVPAALILAVAAWRSTAYAAHRGTAGPDGLRAGLWLGAGLVVGELAVDITAGGRWLPEHPLALLVLPLGALAYVPWLVQCARLGLAPGRRGRVAAVVATAAAVLVAAAGLAWWSTGGHLYTAGDFLAQSGIREVLLQQFPEAWERHRAELEWIAAVLPRLGTDGSTVAFAAAAGALWALPYLLWLLGGRRGLGRALRRGLLGGVLCVVGVLAVKAALYPGRPPLGERAGGFALRYMWWLTVAIWAAVVVTAVVVALVSRRLWLVGALVAAGIAQAFALVAVFLLMSVDGCLGPLRTMGDSCLWVPQGSWPLVRMLAGPVLPALFGAAMAAALVRLPLALVRRWSGGPQVDGREADGRVARSGARRAVLAGVLVGALALGPVAVQASASGSGSGSAGGLGSAVQRPADARSERVRVFQLLMWYLVGGKQDVLALIEGYRAFYDEVQELDRMAREHPGEQIQVDGSRFAGICTTLDRAAGTALGHLHIPDSGLDGPWWAALEQTRRAGQHCAQVMDRDREEQPGEGDAVLAEVADGFRSTVGAIEPVMRRIETDGPRYWPDLVRITGPQPSGRAEG
ncbi:M48 family metalloprotease [Kitasatospora sp. NPDC058444]|uniref:M48 family metalloprotease n=1 Tax=Kitasatospora sp. NPDC058444 TaxID=3346504 RepID=UPI0036672F68